MNSLLELQLRLLNKLKNKQPFMGQGMGKHSRILSCLAGLVQNGFIEPYGEGFAITENGINFLNTARPSEQMGKILSDLIN